MLPIFTAQQIRDLDSATITRKKISSIELMESACRSFVQWFVENFDAANTVTVVCGPGNNGGDGLGVARLLSEWHYPVSVWLVNGGVKESGDFKMNLDRLPAKVRRFNFTDAGKPSKFECDVLIDAIFGSGLSRPADGVFAEAINAVNETDCSRIAIDIPSGLFIDKHSEGVVVKAHTTISFQLPKLAFMLPENGAYVGRWELVDIGLDRLFISETPSSYYYLTRPSMKKLLRPRSTFDHKGIYGRALLIAGSYGKMGACVLAARAALRAGVGLLTAHVPGLGNSIIQTGVPEAMASIDPDEKIFTSAQDVSHFDVIGIGPGLGQEERTVNGLRKILETGKPTVIDADALNILSSHRELMHIIPAGSILTPHPKEFERLTGPWQHDFDRLQRQITFAKEANAVIVLKGAHTSIATPAGKVYFNSTGNPGMATGGSGDVLTGILTSLLAQGYSAEHASILGVYIHGLSGDIAARERGTHSLIASDLITFLPAAFRDL